MRTITRISFAYLIFLSSGLQAETMGSASPPPSTSSTTTTTTTTTYASPLIDSKAKAMRDPRRMLTKDGVCFLNIRKTATGDKTTVTCPETQEMVSAWDKQAEDMTAAGKKVSLATGSPLGCTCGKTTATKPGTCTQAMIEAELKKLKDILAQIEIDLKKLFPDLGSGWWGNLTGGPKCNEIADQFNILWAKYATGVKFTCINVTTAFDSGWLPWDLLAHIACGVTLKGSNDFIYIIDPWRYGTCDLQDPKNCPNSFGDEP